LAKAAKSLRATASLRHGRKKLSRPKHPLRTFALWVALPTIAVYLVVCALVMQGLQQMSDEMNEIDSDRGRSAISAAISSVVKSLGDGVSDEATWTEAYINTYVEPNPAWFDATWGTTARISHNYDTALVTDPEGNISFGESNRGEVTGTLADHVSGATALLERLDATVARLGDDAPVFSAVARNGGVAALAGAVIHGNTGQASVPRDQRRILWLARQIDDTMLADMAELFRLPAMRLVSHVAPGEDSLVITDAAGTEVGTIAWQPRRPGDPAFRHVAGLATLVMLVIGGLTTAVLVAFWSSIKGRAASDERDWFGVRFDDVTGLYNRFGLEERLRTLVSRKQRTISIAVLSIGVDGLTEVFGLYGREVGEQLLEAIADRIEALCDERTDLARTGPAEFMLARGGDGAAQLVRGAAALLLARAAEAVAVGDLKLKIGVSMGLAEAEASRDTFGTVMRQGETALARARETGGSHVVEYDPAMDDERRRRLDVQADIRRGLEADEFDLEYQPIIDFTSGTIIGVEALMRWKRRAGGPMGPGDFIPAAEASGLIDDLGMFALNRAIAEIGPIEGIKISVNVSGVQLRNPGLATAVLSTLKEWGVEASRLQLEVTETFLVAQPERAKRALEALRSNGIAIALDDFGTGYSSIGYLRQFRFDRVKLDRSLVADIDRDPVQTALVESTMSYAYAMNLAVTAEGVERREEAALLSRLGCREFQGYLFARPMTLPQLQQLLAAQTASDDTERLAG
jgi:diguanylate cyclase (GGDEF)-like protein